MTVVLTQPGVRAVLDPVHGGRLASLTVHGHELLVASGAGPTEWGCFPMVPWAGRVGNGRFEWSDRVHHLPLYLPPHALHGTVFSTPWERVGDASIQSTLGPDWPWPGTVRSDLELTQDSLLWRMTVSADSSAFPCVMGWHPWFRRRLSDRGAVAVQFDAAEMYERGPNGLPTGRRVPPSSGPWDDCFTAVQANPRLVWPEGIAVDIESTCAHWVVYDEPEHAVCIEPQSAPPDAFNLGGCAVARPGQPVVHTMRLRWTASREA